MAAAYFKYKKASLNLKFSSAKDTLMLMQGAIKEYKNTKSIYIKRAIIGYFQDFSEYIIDMSETYLVMSDNYIRCKVLKREIIKCKKNGMEKDIIV